MTTATYSADEVARMFGVSSWTLYRAVKDDTCPVRPIRIGKRRLVWSRSAVDRLLGLDHAESIARLVGLDNEDRSTAGVPVDMPLTRGR